jgi:mRNA interferase MazF
MRISRSGCGRMSDSVPSLGDVWQATYPPSNGHEQMGSRPVLVLQDNKYGRGAPIILAVPFSTRLRTQRFDGTVLIEPDEHNGLTAPSVVLVFQLRALDKSRFDRRIGRVERDQLMSVYEELDRLTGRYHPTDSELAKDNE